ncbi:MAG: hypothetical protein DYG93_01080 [Leptolyngbya sp. PLA2]|nr:hypothetical protein [Leptolyngbya sp. PL-A2]MCQ3941358.1 hypothetical protein [cyanobacterium CYA1]MCZ7632901.1 hypothetical protein [Phycisphaerales bacterium]MDL1904469.1 hypothetical protein [Synechococcales cyanobacterium CNB]GIK19025.1 MAG: hypothetical protein BroJett004_11890 [Planctomycetota bacterium]
MAATFLRWCVLACVIGTLEPCGVLAQDAAPQPAAPDALRAENDSLRAEVQRLRAALDEALRRLAAAEAALARLGAPLGTTTEDTEPAAVDAPADPLASPVSMLVELRRRYERDLAGAPSDAAARRAAVAAWCRSIRAELKGRREWLVTIAPVEEPGVSPSRPEAMVRIYDEALLRPIGEAVRVRIPARHAAQVRGRPDQRLWTLTANVAAAPRFEERRETEGVFNHPPFIGPYAEFAFELEWVSLTASPRVLPAPPDAAPSATPPPAPGQPR